MKLAILILAVFGVAGAPVIGPAHAQEPTPYAAKTLQAGCRAYANNSTAVPEITEAYKEGICVGIFSAMIAYGPAMEPELRFCPPEGASYKEGMRMVLRGLDSQPDLLDEDLRNVIVAVLRYAWPCKK